MIVTEKTQEEISIPLSHKDLITRRRPGQGMIISFGDEEVILLVETSSKINAMVRVYAPARVKIIRIEEIR